MDWAHVLIWIVCIATGLNTAILLWTRAGLRHAKTWLALQLTIFVGTAGGAFLKPKAAAIAGGLIWFLLVMAPSLLLRLLYRLSARRAYAQAIWVTRILRLVWIHPAEGLVQQRKLLSILHQISKGEEAPALERLAELAAVEGPLQQTARYFTFYLQDDWPGLHEWIQEELRQEEEPEVKVATTTKEAAAEPKATGTPALVGSPVEAPFDEANAEANDGAAVEVDTPVALEPTGTQLFWMIRALAEMGQLEEAIALYQEHESRLREQGDMVFELWAVLLAFAGRISAVQSLINGPLYRWAPQSRALLLATVELSAGEEAAGRERLAAVIATGDPIIKQRAEVRLKAASEVAGRGAALPATQRDFLDQITETMHRELRYVGKESLHKRPWLTWAFSLSLVLVFCLLEWRGGSTTSHVLLQMGAMMPSLVLKGDYWRLAAFPMLHYGAVHLVLNVMALLLFGPFVERTLGGWRFLVLYVFSGVGGGVLITSVVYFNPSSQLHQAAYVGASGAIFGLIGGTLAILLKGWLREKVPQAKQRIKWLLLIIALQTSFDLNTPKVSLGAHWSGLILGIIVVLFLWSPMSAKRRDLIASSR